MNDKFHQHTRTELIKTTTKQFCLRHNVKSIKEYQEKLNREIENE